MSFSQALSGLNAQQQSLGAIGNNIANSQTVGFKSSSVQFADVFANSRIGLGTRVSAVLQNFNEGNVESTNRNLDLAISGTGFYRFEQGGEVVYSRNGQLTLTPEGFLQNAQGARLMGYPYNEATGAVMAGGQPGVLQVNSDELQASATTNVATTFNLDSRYEADDLNEATVRTTLGEDPDTQAINYHYSNNFTVYDSLGNPKNITVYYEKIDQDVDGNAVTNTWNAKV
ncbi:MAG: flagellar hook-basal body complex protein, partial [Halomonas sp.]|uniref:flagellar hook-basal body complex protein n=1 Tax=Halomonas sp. TaxID=1486246 RepID=UPI0019FF391C